MNAQSIWAGEEYAFSPYRPNDSFVMHARKVRAIKVERRKEWGKSRLSAYLIGTELDRETGEEKGQIEVRARDVIDFWDNYENERKAKRKKAEDDRAEAERQRLVWQQEREERLARERAEAERKEREQTERREKLVNAMVERGIPREAITSVGVQSIHLDRMVMEVWLSNGNV